MITFKRKFLLKERPNMEGKKNIETPIIVVFTCC